MTVTELREALEKLEAEGKGALPIGFRDCICYDSDYEMEFCEISVAEQPEITPPGPRCSLGFDRQRIELA